MVRHIKPVSPLAAVVGCLVFLAVYIASGDESLKEYLNVAIPMPETADFSPIIIDALPERTVFARINHLSLQEQPIPQRDAQVLAGTRSDWRFVGKNGEGISGASPFTVFVRRAVAHWVIGDNFSCGEVRRQW